MREGKVYKELPSKINKTKQTEGLKLVDNRPLNIKQAKLIDTIQREPMELDEFKRRYKTLFEKYFAPGGNVIHRFTSTPNERIGLAVNIPHVLDQITGVRKAIKPLSFGYNLDALIATGLSGKGDKNIWAYAQNADYLCSINMDGYSELKKNGFTIWTGTSNELTVFETECVLGVNSLTIDTSLAKMKENPQYGQFIDIIPNPMKDSDAPTNESIQSIIQLINTYKPGQVSLSKGVNIDSAEKAMKWLETNLDKIVH